jgi:hypothetical protein
MQDTKQVVYRDNCNGTIKAVKDMRDFGGTDMWNIYIKVGNGWESVQWMSRYKASRIVGKDLPSYKYKSNNRNSSEIVPA